jgi:excisionase family DNA binding protein
MNSDDVLTTQEAAAMLGAHIETVRRLARRGAIPAFKVGKDWRFSSQALRRWAAAQQETRQQQPTVLVVDDDASVTKLMRRCISPLGCLVLTSGTGSEALDIIRWQPVDLVLLDLYMPEMNGAEFIAQFRQKQENTPVIIVTGHPESDLLVRAMQFGPLLLLQKPVQKAPLLSAVNLALQGRLSGQDSPASSIL